MNQIVINVVLNNNFGSSSDEYDDDIRLKVNGKDFSIDLVRISLLSYLIVSKMAACMDAL